MITTPDISLIDCGNMEQTEPYTLTDGDDHSFFLIMSGMRAIIRINDRQYYLQPFTFLFHPFEKGKVVIESQGAIAYRYMRLRFSDNYIQYLRKQGMTVKETHTLVQPLSIEEVWKLILCSMRKPDIGSKMGIHALELMLCLLLEASDGSVTRAAEVPHYDKLTALRQKIYTHPEESWFIQDICEQLSISRPYFHKIYLGAFGTTCTQDVITSRIVCARRLLEETDEAIATVSQLSGFETDVYFMRQFKRHVGMTPTAYRRIYRQTAANEKAEEQKKRR